MFAFILVEKCLFENCSYNRDRVLTLETYGACIQNCNCYYNLKTYGNNVIVQHLSDENHLKNHILYASVSRFGDSLEIGIFHTYGEVTENSINFTYNSIGNFGIVIGAFYRNDITNSYLNLVNNSYSKLYNRENALYELGHQKGNTMVIKYSNFIENICNSSIVINFESHCSIQYSVLIDNTANETLFSRDDIITVSDSYISSSCSFGSANTNNMKENSDIIEISINETCFIMIMQTHYQHHKSRFQNSFSLQALNVLSFQ